MSSNFARSARPAAILMFIVAASPLGCGQGLSSDPVGAGGAQGGGSAGAAGGFPAEGGHGGEDEPVVCDPNAPFVTVRRVPGLPEGAARLRLNPDETIGYYAFPQSGASFDLFVARRASRDEPFGEGMSLSFNGADWDFSPTQAGEGAHLYFESQRTGTWQIHRSTLQAGDNVYGPIELVPGLNGAVETAAADGGPFITPSGHALYYHRRRGDVTTLARAQRTGDSFDPPELISFSGISIPGGPVPSRDELTLYFSAFVSADDIDVWRARRASRDDAFGSPSEVRELNTSENDVPSFLSPDGCRLYFDRVASGPLDWGKTRTAYVAEREPQ